MNWLTRLIPSRAAIFGVMVAAFAIFTAWARRDARKDAVKDIRQKDMEHAREIETRIADDRADPERLRPFEDRGYRD